MIRFLPGSIELVLHRRVAVLATSSDAAARQAVRAQLQEAVTAAENLARQAEAGEAPDGRRVAVGCRASRPSVGGVRHQ